MRTLWALIKLGAFVALGVWLVMQPGRTTVHGFGYEADLPTGALIFAGLIFAYLFAKLYQLMLAIARTPKNIAKALDARSQDHALAAVSHGLSAIAAGDAHAAEKQAAKARKLIKHDHGLVPLLDGMTARLKGDAVAAETAFRELMGTKETAFIGVRGLLQLALDRGQPDQALVLARQAHRMHPKQAWITDVLYNLEVQARHWDEALKLAHASVKAKTKTQEDFRNDKAAMLLARATESSAKGQADQAYLLTRESYEAAPQFLPAVLAYLPYLLRRDDKKKATKIIEKTWSVAPHPALVETWMKLAPDAKKESKSARDYMWLEKLAATNPDHEESHLMLAEAAMAQDLAGPARTHLDAALSTRQSQIAYRLLAKLEERVGNLPAADIMHERQVTALAPRVWVDRDTGQVFPMWMPFTPPQNSFNRIVWDVPGNITRKASSLLPAASDPLQLLDSRAA
ncbi:MAG TPA: heme biosynthesis HemY N-terminal domain-containing protein [Alphaproteobacteria bacterium]